MTTSTIVSTSEESCGKVGTVSSTTTITVEPMAAPINVAIDPQIDFAITSVTAASAATTTTTATTTIRNEMEDPLQTNTNDCVSCVMTTKSSPLTKSNILWTDIFLHIAQFHVTSLADIYLVWNLVSREVHVQIQRFTYEWDRTDLSIERLFGNIFRMRQRQQPSSNERRRNSSATCTARRNSTVSVPELLLSNDELAYVNEHDVFHHYLRHCLFTRSKIFHSPRPVSVYNDSYYCFIKQLDFVFVYADVEHAFLSCFPDHRVNGKAEPFQELLVRMHFQVCSDFSLGPLQRADFSKLYLVIEDEGDTQIHLLPFKTSKFSIFDLTSCIKGVLTYQLTDIDLTKYWGKPDAITLKFQYGVSGYSTEVLFENNAVTMEQMPILKLLYNKE
jgi:hypothetical protein